jgi:hypothetical protein
VVDGGVWGVVGGLRRQVWVWWERVWWSEMGGVEACILEFNYEKRSRPARRIPYHTIAPTASRFR